MTAGAAPVGKHGFAAPGLCDLCNPRAATRFSSNDDRMHRMAPTGFPPCHGQASPTRGQRPTPMAEAAGRRARAGGENPLASRAVP